MYIILNIISFLINIFCIINKFFLIPLIVYINIWKIKDIYTSRIRKILFGNQSDRLRSSSFTKIGGSGDRCRYVNQFDRSIGFGICVLSQWGTPRAIYEGTRWMRIGRYYETGIIVGVLQIHAGLVYAAPFIANVGIPLR